MTASLRRGIIYSFDPATWTAVVQLDGSVGEVVMPVGEWVPAGMLALDDAVAVLLFDDTNPDDGVVLGAYGGVSGWSYPALSGLTTGQPLRATSATAAAFGALDLANTNATTGALPVSRGGTGLTAAPGNGQLPIGNGSGYALAGLTGTANQLTVTNGAGTITLSTPQNTHTSATPTFGALTLSTNGSGGGLTVSDVQLYRSAADVWRSPDALIVDTYLEVNGGNSGVALQMTRASGNQIGIAFTQTSIGNNLIYMPASSNFLHFQSGGNNNLSLDNANRRVGIKNAAPAHELDVTGEINASVAHRTAGTQVVGPRKTGWSAWTGTPTRSSKATSTATLANVAEALKALLDDLISHGLIGA